jgi:hypothetical protein
MDKAIRTRPSRRVDDVVRGFPMKLLEGDPSRGKLPNYPNEVHNSVAAVARAETSIRIHDIAGNNLIFAGSADLGFTLASCEKANMMTLFFEVLSQRPAYIARTTCEQNLHLTDLHQLSVCGDLDALLHRFDSA